MNAHRPFLLVGRDHPRPHVPANDVREQADAEHATAISLATLLIVGTLCFAAGALALAALAFVIVALS